MISPEKAALVAAQDLKLIKALAGNNPKVRNRALRNLRKWFEHRNLNMPFVEEDFMRIWKGLFYTMWMSDKSLVQEECAENIAHLVHCFEPTVSLLFFKCALNTMISEWFGIDQLRLDKFLMFVRRILRQALVLLRGNDWDSKSVTGFVDILSETVLAKDNGKHLGLTMHISEIYLEELAKISEGKIEPDLVTRLVEPFARHLSRLNDERQIKHIQRHVFYNLLRQSDEAVEYHAKFVAWKNLGFPTGSIECMGREEEGEEEDDNDEEEEDEEEEEPAGENGKPLDPRAGQVDVVLPRIRFNAAALSELLLRYKFSNKESTTTARKFLVKLANKFETMSKGDFPLGLKKIPLAEDDDDDGYSTDLRKSVDRLVKFDKKLLADSNKNRKRRLRDRSKEAKLKTQKPSCVRSLNGIRSDTETREHSAEPVNNGAECKRQKIKSTSKKKPKLSESTCFRRNSGVWIVDELDTNNSQESHTSNMQTFDIVNNTAEAQETIAFVTSKENVSSSDDPRNKWNTPLKEGEYEIFVPAKKLRNKLSIKKVTDVLYNLNSMKRHSLDSNLVKNPFAKAKKKVKIDLKLNRSQEIYEHHARILNSPAIPYDADKRPSKPLLKRNSISSPRNPFHKRIPKL